MTKEKKDMETVVSRLRNGLMDAKAAPESALALWQEDGSFEGVEYFNPSVLKWNASVHLEYLRTMIKAAYSEGNPSFGNAELKKKIAKSMEFWAYGGRVECENWWCADIGIPDIMADILLLNPEEITGEMREIFSAEANRGNPFLLEVPDRIRDRPIQGCGANLTDYMKARLRVSAAAGNEEELFQIMNVIDNEMRVFETVRSVDTNYEDCEGIKADYSFHAHFEQVQFGGYGEFFVEGISFILEITKGTKFRVSDRALNEFTNFLLDGISWAYRGEYGDFTVSGRRMSRPEDCKGRPEVVKAAMEVMQQFPHIERYEELKTVYEQHFVSKDTFEGNRHFWLSDYMSHHRSGYYAGVKISSSRTKSGEAINSENMLGYYQSDGVTCLMRRGDEYDRIYPVWDWNKLPGTTTPQGALRNMEELSAWVDGNSFCSWKGNLSFVGGVSDGRYGAAVMDYYRDGLAAQKAWFFFDDEMAALGNRIGSFHEGEIYTTLNQCLLNGDVIIGKDGKAEKAEKGTQQIENADYIWHDGIGYMCKNNLTLTTEQRTGKWHTINYSKKGEETKDVFQIGISHGVRPSHEAYEYMVLFDKDAEETAEYTKNPKVSVLHNDNAIQAVYHSGLKMAQAVLWRTDTLHMPGGLLVSSNKKCMLIVQELESGRVRIAVSNPENYSKDIKIMVNRSLPVLNKYITDNGDGTTTITFRLNEGIYAGSSTVYDSETGFDRKSIMNRV